MVAQSGAEERVADVARESAEARGPMHVLTSWRKSFSGAYPIECKTNQRFGDAT